jgi:hypothetical protein
MHKNAVKFSTGCRTGGLWSSTQLRRVIHSFYCRPQVTGYRPGGLGSIPGATRFSMRLEGELNGSRGMWRGSIHGKFLRGLKYSWNGIP